MTMIAARARGVAAPRIREKDVAAAESWPGNPPVYMDSNGKWAQCGADPAVIAGVACTAYGDDVSGFNPLGVKGFPPGRCQVTLAGDEQQFHAEYVGTKPSVAGGSYGIVKGSDGFWRVDFTDTTNTRVVYDGDYITDPSVATPTRVLFHFLAANVQDIG